MVHVTKEKESKKMKCEKCGSEIKQLIISVSDAYGSDCSISVDITECEKNAVVF